MQDYRVAAYQQVTDIIVFQCLNEFQKILKKNFVLHAPFHFEGRPV